MSTSGDDKADLVKRIQALEETIRTTKVLIGAAIAVFVGMTGVAFYQIPRAAIAALRDSAEHGALEKLKSEADIALKAAQNAKEKFEALDKSGPLVGAGPRLVFTLPGRKSATQRAEFDFPVKNAWVSVLGNKGHSKDFTVKLDVKDKSVDVDVTNEGSTLGLELTLQVFAAKY
jgi:hypothetical protein